MTRTQLTPIHGKVYYAPNFNISGFSKILYVATNLNCQFLLENNLLFKTSEEAISYRNLLIQNN